MPLNEMLHVLLNDQYIDVIFIGHLLLLNIVKKINFVSK